MQSHMELVSKRFMYEEMQFTFLFYGTAVSWTLRIYIPCIFIQCVYLYEFKEVEFYHGK